MKLYKLTLVGILFFVGVGCGQSGSNGSQVKVLTDKDYLWFDASTVVKSVDTENAELRKVMINELNEESVDLSWRIGSRILRQEKVRGIADSRKQANVIIEATKIYCNLKHTVCVSTVQAVEKDSGIVVSKVSAKKYWTKYSFGTLEQHVTTTPSMTLAEAIKKL